MVGLGWVFLGFVECGSPLHLLQHILPHQPSLVGFFTGKLL
jgi:hypothetical protein